jgi:Flp pilus assembly protein TadG
LNHGFLRQLANSFDGSALIEATVLLPVLLALFGGAYEFGFLLYREQLVTTGIRDAARYLALSCDPTSAVSQTEAKNLAVSGSADGGAPRVTGWDTTSVSVAVDFLYDASHNYQTATSSCLPNIGSAIPIITVSTRFADPSLGFLGLLGLKVRVINVSHEERWVGGSAPS